MRKIALCMGVVLAAIMLAAFMPGSSPARTETPSLMVSAIQGPEDYYREPLDLPLRAQTAVSMTAVAIVGDVDNYTTDFRNDMEGAVAALQGYGVDVTTFYYGQQTFSWTDIVNAATGANFLLYAGHGIYWSGSCTAPDLVGGFFLGENDGNGNFGYIHPDTVRTDLTGRMADQAVVLMSHVCYSAGSTACDSSTAPDVTEASRRVQMYADPFMDAGFRAYYANNYYDSFDDTIHDILVDSNRPTYGESFKSNWPYNPSEFYDYDFDADDEKWLSGSPGNWDDAFVGKADETFTADQQDPPSPPATPPELGYLPSGALAFYDQSQSNWITDAFVLWLDNIASTEAITVLVETDAPWLSPQSVQVTTPVTLSLGLVGTPTMDSGATMTLTLSSATQPVQDQYVIPLEFLVESVVQQTYLPMCTR